MDAAFQSSLSTLQKVRSFNGDPAQFWPAFLDALTSVSRATAGVVAVSRPGTDDPAWRLIGVSPAGVQGGVHVRTVFDMIAELAADCEASGIAEREGGALEKGNVVAAVKLELGPGTSEICVAALFLEHPPAERVKEVSTILRLVADVPMTYQAKRIIDESRTHVERLTHVLDLSVLMNAETRFLAAAMVFCNELAARLRCDRVSLGWLEKGYIRLQAISRVEQFDKKMEAAQKLEAAMEEALDQDREIFWPPSQGDAAVVRDHETFARQHGDTNLCSLPLRLNREAVAVCTCERSGRPFSEIEIHLLRLSCDQAVRRLADLKRYDRWFGARLATAAREQLEQAVGVEHTWAKSAAIGGAILLAFLCFVPLRYRVEAPCILRTDDVAYLASPFDGHIDKVSVRIGDSVKRGTSMLELDRSDLLLEESAAIAERNRYKRESEKARANNALADMRIADAMSDQAGAKLDLVRYRLEESVIRAPFDGEVVEGDLMERIGAPVRQGDVLFKLARVERLYVEMEVSEKDIHEVSARLAEGEIALSSRPQDAFRVKVFRMAPSAVPKESGNIFIVHGAFAVPAQPWWRPGMTGIAKLNAGRRTLLWMMTHRTIDFLRLRLWW